MLLMCFSTAPSPTKSAAATKLHSGDQVWWDRHDNAAAKTIAAVVGSYPAPFLGGYGGQRYPTRIECTQTKASACTSVLDQLATYGIPAALGCFECSEYNLSLRVLVGPYATITTDPAAEELRDGPSTSGVFARFIDGGSKLELLNAHGAVKQTFGAGTGLVAVSRRSGSSPEPTRRALTTPNRLSQRARSTATSPSPWSTTLPNRCRWRREASPSASAPLALPGRA